MKKAYKAPLSRVFDLQPEGCLLANSNSISLNSTKVGGSSALSNKKSIWNSSNWPNTGD